MAKFRCDYCGFSFSRQSENPPLRCPNCARENSVYCEVDDKNLLKNVDDMIK